MSGMSVDLGAGKPSTSRRISGDIQHREAKVQASNNVHLDEKDDSTDLAIADDVEGYGVRPTCFRNTAQELLFVFITTMAMGMNAFLLGAITVIPNFVAKDLSMTQAELTWLTASSSLSSGAFLLFFGRMADLFGQKPLIIASFGLFAVFSLACGFAKSPIVLDVLNGMLGVMAAAAVPPAQGALSVIYGKPSRRKNAAFACFSAGNPVGFACGMVFSGIATQLFSWRASFWLLAIIYAVFTVAAVFCMPADTIPKRSLNWETFQRFDVVGMLLTISGIAMFSAALSLGSTAPQDWKTPYVLVLLIVGFFLIIGFVLWEKSYPHPLMPMYIWKDKNFSLLMVILLLGFMAFPPAMFFVALFFQRVWQFSAISTAVHILPLAVMGIIVNIFAGVFLHRINNKLLMFVGTFSYTVCFILLAVNRTSSSYWAFCFPAFLLCVVGADLEFNVANMYVMTTLPVDQQSIAGGIFQTVTRLSTTISFGIVTAVFDNVSSKPSFGGWYKAYPEVQPYSAVLWYTAGLTALSTILVVFLTIGTQGGKGKGQGSDHEKRSPAVS